MVIIKMKNEDIVKPADEEKRLHTSLNLLESQTNALSKIAETRNMSKTAIMDEVIRTYLSKENETTQIDQMLSATNGFWFNRDLERTKQLLTPEKAKLLLPEQTVYLYLKLRDAADRNRVFEALGLNDVLMEFNTVNKWLEEVSNFKDERLVGYNLDMLAHKVHAKLTQTQELYLAAKLGKSSMEKLRKHIIEKFPHPQLFKENNAEKSSSDDPPTLETVLSAIGEPEKAWNALPEPLRKQIQEAVGNENFEFAKGLATAAKIAAKIALKPR